MPPQTPANDGGVQQKVDAAKAALAKSRTRFGDNPDYAPKAKPVKPVTVAPVAKPLSAGLLGEAQSAAEGIGAKNTYVDEYLRASGAAPGAPKPEATGIPSMHEGGKVEEDGPKNLKKGETVLPKNKKKAEELAMKHLGKKAGILNDAKDELDEEKKEGKKDSPKEEKKEKHTKHEKPVEKKVGEKHVKHNFDETIIKHHKNGSHTTRHIPHAPKPDADGKMGQAEPEVSYASPDFASLQQGLASNLGENMPTGQGSAAAPAPAAV